MPTATKPELIDSFGRTVRDLRISVTDRCNFRCTYCMPEEGMKWLPRTDVLTYEELFRVARICVERFGVDGVRLTGGEPTVRAHLPVLIEKLATLVVPPNADSPRAGQPIDVALTTNGATLALVADDLRRAGLSRINVSLDTLQRERFKNITKRDELDSVLEGIDAAVAVGLQPVKVNVVVQRGVNDDEIVALAAFGRERGVEVRFIEFMPLDAQGHWMSDAVVGQDEIVSTINNVFPLEQIPARGAAPADRWIRRWQRHGRSDSDRHQAVLW
jgi:GTP 3',8-cyclase